VFAGQVRPAGRTKKNGDQMIAMPASAQAIQFLMRLREILHRGARQAVRFRSLDSR
jgi:hypothetical protein